MGIAADEGKDCLFWETWDLSWYLVGRRVCSCGGWKIVNSFFFNIFNIFYGYNVNPVLFFGTF